MQKPLAQRPFSRLTRLIWGEGGTARLSTGSSYRVRNRARWLRMWLVARWSDDLFVSRTTAHLAVFLLIVTVIALGSTAPVPRSFAFPWRTSARAGIGPESATTLGPGAADGTSNEAGSFPSNAAAPLLSGYPLENDGEILVRAAVPHTIIPERPRDEITQYVVKSGDTIFGIAARFNLAPETIMWANGRFVEDNPDLLRLGQELTILPVDGVYHQVGGVDTVQAIAAAYKVEPAAIIDYTLNNLDAENPQITAGQWLIVPGGSKPYVARSVVAYSGPIPEDASKGTGIFGWPAAGQITQSYWDRHRALDIGAWKGAPVLAADSGYVVAAGWDDAGYGRTVLLDHGNGFQTLYAHMQVYFVEVGDSVAKGERIGEVGSTGNSTGPHLHFEVRQGSVQRNPFGFLP